MKICNLNGWESGRQKTGKCQEAEGMVPKEKGPGPAAFLKLDAYSEIFPIVSDTLELILNGGAANFPATTAMPAPLS